MHFSKTLPLLVACGARALEPPKPEDSGVNGTSFLDHDAPISGFWGKTFLKDNIPYIDIPDQDIQKVYYYRWSSLQRHLRYTVPGTGYILTEFCQPVGYAQAFGTIDAAAGHQIDEARWLRSAFYDNDYIQVYTRGPANSVQYTNWILDAMSRRALVTGDKQFLSTQVADMIRMWQLWDPYFDNGAGLYFFTPDFDAQEYSLPGYVADAAVGNTNDTLKYVGPDTYRPSHNGYMVANARAIANAASLAGDSATATKYNQTADNIEAAMYQHLWAPAQQFFMDVIRPNNSNLTTLTGREQVGLFPFRFGIGLNSTYAAPAAGSLWDPQGFLADYGPTTLEIRNQYYTATKPDSYCCYWNGQSWPYSTSHTLKSLAAIHRTGTSNITADNYYQYLRKYALTQQKDGVPYVAESHYPFQNAWSADTTNHSEHYDHSTNNDDVISGLLGIIPQANDSLVISPIIPANWTYFALENLPYHGHLVTVLYDADGSRYKKGAGLTVFVDGNQVYNGTQANGTVPIAARPSSTNSIAVNIAANAAGLGQYPKADATFTYNLDNPYKAIDGALFYDSTPDNRWTNYQSTNGNDTLTITFPRPRNVTSVTLALFSDVARGGSVDTPSAIEIYGSNGLLANFTNGTSFLANDKNTFTFNQVETQSLAVSMHRKSGSVWVGVCELEVWVPPNNGSFFYAVDAYLTGGANVTTDKASSATSNGAVVSGLGNGTVVAFSGVPSKSGLSKLTLRYANYGPQAAMMGVRVNQVVQANLTAPPTGGAYQTVYTELITLADGNNFINIEGGNNGVRLESITIG